MSFVRTLALVMFSALIACGGGSEEEAYATLQECFDDHTIEEGLTIEQAITVCTLDHEIAGGFLDFATIDECIAFVDAELSTESASEVEIEAGCQDYIDQKDM